MHLEEMINSNVQRKNVARKFHSCIMNSVQGTTSQLNELVKIEEFSRRNL